MIKFKKWLFTLLISLFLIRIVMIIMRLHFYSIYAEEAFFCILLFLGVILLFLSLKSTGRIILTIVSITVSPVLYLVVMYFTWLFIGTIDEIRPEKFKNLNQKVWMQFHQGSWGGRPYFTVGLGESYFWGLMYKKESEFEFDFEAPNMNSDKYDLPKNITSPEQYVFWEEKGWLFDFEKKICYKLNKRTRVELSQNERDWKQIMEKDLDASIFMGKGSSNIESIYENPSTVYLTLNFKDSNYIKSLTNSEIEQLSAKIGNSLSAILKNNTNYKLIDLHYVTIDHRKIYAPDYNQDYKYARFDLKKKETIPNLAGTDYVKMLYIPWTKFLRISYDEYEEGRNDSQSVFSNSLGLEMHHINDIGPVRGMGQIRYKGLDCQLYKGRNPAKIKVKNGYLINTFQYILFEGELVDVVITYECFPANSKFSYNDVVEKLTYDEKSDTPDKMFYRYIDKNYLKFRFETDESIINCNADTSKIPWKITYNTSISNPTFMYLYK